MKNNLDSTTIEIRPLDLADEPFLWKMVYQALHVPKGQPPFPPEIVQAPEISRYARDWGQPDDLGFVAVVNGQPVGAVWLRLLTGNNRGYGYVDEYTPELSIAILPEYRGQGLGQRLIVQLLETVRLRYTAICLSVSSDNPAQRLYRRLGFEVIADNHSDITMVKRWSA